MIIDPQPNTTSEESQVPSRVRFGVLVLIALAASSAYLTRHCLAVANTTIQKDLHISEEQMGWVLGVFGAGYFLCQIPAGWLGNRMGTRAAYSLLSVLWSLLTIWSAAATTMVSLLASRVMFGMAQAGMVPISAKIINDWFPERRRGFCSATIGAAMSLGGVTAMGLTGWLMRDFDWRMIFRAYSLVGIVWAVVFYLYFRTRPENHSRVNQSELGIIRNRDFTNGTQRSTSNGDDSPSLSTLELIGKMLHSRTIWAINIQSAFRAAAYMLFVTWFPAFLEYRYSLTPTDAGKMAMWPLAGVVVGSLTGGVVIDFLLKSTGSKWISRSAVAVAALSLAGLFTLSSSLATQPTLFVVLMSAAAFNSGIGSPAAWAATIDVSGRYTAVVVGAMNMSGALGGFTMPVVLGYLIGDIKQTGGDWNLVIYFVSATYALGAVSWLAVNPQKSISQHNAV
jgi:MFS family permease